MFKCDSCKRMTGPNIPQAHHVVETRMAKQFARDEDGVLVPVGTGEQIVREIHVCPLCDAQRTGSPFVTKKYWIGPNHIEPSGYDPDVVAMPEKPTKNRQHLASED